MFTYRTLSKSKNVATIKLVNNPEEIYVPAQQERDEDFSSFTL